MSERTAMAAKTARPAAALNAMRLLQRKCACGNNTTAGGECDSCTMRRLQRKLSIGATNDPLELEADRIADQVLAAPLNSGINGATPRIQRFTGEMSGRKDSAPASVDRALADSGRPLEPSLQEDMGRRFGHDFSRVRVHSGSTAEQSAREVNAHAYTVGHNIVFGAGRFAPRTREGRRLLSHELTHVIQQSDAVGTLQRDVAIEPVSSETEISLSRGEIVGALAHNQRWFTDRVLIAEIRDLLGIARIPAVIDEDFVMAVARWQAANGITQDGRVGRITKIYLAEEFEAEGLPLVAQQLRGMVPASHVVDIDSGFCGCQQELTDSINANLDFINEYETCRNDPNNHTGEQIENCVTAFAARGLGLSTAGTTSSAGQINVGACSGHCGPLKCSETFAHEWSHSSHQRELVRRFGSDTPAFDRAWSESTDWANDEIRARVVGNNFLLWVIARLNQSCNHPSGP